VTASIVDANVTTAKIADDAITSDKIADNAINSANMITGAVINTANIVDDAVTEDKLSASALTFIKSALYPVGYILSTVTNYANSADVVAAFGGTTWVRFGAGRVPVGYDSGDTDFDTAEGTGGDKTKSKTIALNELPNHKHAVPNKDCNNGYATGEGLSSDNVYRNTWCDTNGFGQAQTPLTGNGVYADNGTRQTQQAMSLDVVQPYIVVYMWKRTL
jgi:hypothetical protein